MNKKGTAFKELIKSVDKIRNICQKNLNPKVEVEMGPKEKYPETLEKDFHVKEQ